MKNIDELNEQEILVLSEEDIQKLILLECAMNGVPLPKKVEEPEYKEVLPADVTLYQVGEIYTTDKELAEQISSLLIDSYSKLNGIDYNWKEGLKVLESMTGEAEYKFGVKTLKVYSKNRYEEVKEASAQNVIAKEAYDVAYKDYSHAMDEMRDHANRVRDRVKEVNEKYAEFEFLNKTFQDYLTIANNDGKMAMEFLAKAYGTRLTEEAQDYIEKHNKKVKHGPRTDTTNNG